MYDGLLATSLVPLEPRRTAAEPSGPVAASIAAPSTVQAPRSPSNESVNGSGLVTGAGVSGTSDGCNVGSAVAVSSSAAAVGVDVDSSTGATVAIAVPTGVLVAVAVSAE